MTAVVLGTAMLVAASGASPGFEAPRSAVVPPAFTYDLPEDTATPRITSPHRSLSERSRAEWRSTTLPASQVTTVKRHSKADRVIAVAAGLCLGWFVGAGTGFYTTADRNRDDDGVSGLKGMIIGAPIGAAAGAILGYQLTKK